MKPEGLLASIASVLLRLTLSVLLFGASIIGVGVTLSRIRGAHGVILRGDVLQP